MISDALRRIRLGGILALGILGGCTHSTSNSILVDRWLTCIECTDGELDSLLVRSRENHEALGAMLRQNLADGPTPLQRDAMTVSLQRLYDTLYTPGLARDSAKRSQYAQDYYGRFQRTWRVRSLIALLRTGDTASIVTSAHIRNALFPNQPDTAWRHWQATVRGTPWP